MYKNKRKKKKKEKNIFGLKLIDKFIKGKGKQRKETIFVVLDFLSRLE